ncbi:MAG TPA: malate dehydrogenase [Streptosporangiaceae bacterium]|jgi:malate dehydrogenase
MTVHGADSIERAVQSAQPGQPPALHVGLGDLVTPLAREMAVDRGVRIVTGPVAQPAPSAPGASSPGTVNQPAPPPLRPPSPALFRRGAPLAAEVRPAATEPAPAGRTGRVVVVGAGHVGMITAMRLAEADVLAEVVLVDIADGLAAGIALDLTHTAALLGFSTRVRGVTSVEEAGPADYVVITAGKPRRPGMTRSDLVSTNAAIVGDVARRAARTSPGTVLVVVTNPLDEMTHHAWRASGLPAERVLGMAGVLDTARFQALVSLTGIAAAGDVAGIALGSHGDEMVIPLSQAATSGQSLRGRLDRATVEAIVDRARNSGGEVVSLLKSGSAFMAPGTSAAHMVLAMIRDTGDVLPVTARAHGQYGIVDGYVGLPVRLGCRGAREIVELPLTEDERADVRAAAARIAERVATLESSPAAS